MPNYSSQDEFVAYFAEFPHIKFTDVSGGDEQNDINLQHPGGGGDPEPVEGPTEVGEVTASKPYEPAKDAALILWNKAYSEGVRKKLTLVVQPTTAAGIPDGPPTRYVNCARSSFSTPDVSQGASDTAMLEVTVQPSAKK
ncbi:MAG: hypothetical protein ABEN55_15495 [Bradymonadaceae bacterium]